MVGLQSQKLIFFQARKYLDSGDFSSKSRFPLQLKNDHNFLHALSMSSK
jgi:hypothetical protein